VRFLAADFTMLPISAIGKKFGLSRSTLLYYDRLGLVRPTYRTSAGYRLYSNNDKIRLKKICRYRATGLTLTAIKRLLDDAPSRLRLTTALHQRLTELNHEIASLRRQQQVVLNLLPRNGQDRLARAMTKGKWISLLRSLGLNDAEMMQWHIAFEHQSPLAHQDFLESLGLPEAEICRIRAQAGSGNALRRAPARRKRTTSVDKKVRT
jgi:DNA-binding transcriptional MerR regulator